MLPGHEIVSRHLLYESVLNWILEQIRSGDYPPASRLPSVDQLASTLRVSRSSVREALRVLEAAGLITIKHGHGTFVRANTSGIIGRTDLAIRNIEDMLQLIHARRLIETETAQLASTARTSADLVTIHAALSRMRGPGILLEDAAKHDLAFHLAVAKASKNQVLTNILHALLGSLYQAILLSLGDDSDRARAIVEHEQILDAIESQQPERAKQSMVDHFKVIEQKVAAGLIPSLGRRAEEVI